MEESGEQGQEPTTPPVDYVVWAMVSIWAYLIPSLFAKYGEYKLAIKRSRAWGLSSPQRLDEASSNAKDSFVFHIILGTILYLGTAILVSILTNDMDRRASLISVGFSRLFTGVMCLVLSVNVPQWFGVYHSRNIKKNKVSCRKSVKEIRFALGWSLWKLMASFLLYNAYFACSVHPLSTLYGLLLGVVFGLILVYVTYLARHNCRKSQKRNLAIGLIGIFLIVSWIMVGVGAYWVAVVWYPNFDATMAVTVSVTVGWAIITLITHAILIRWTNRKKRLGLSMRFTSQVFDRRSMVVKKNPTTIDVEAAAGDESKEEDIIIIVNNSAEENPDGGAVNGNDDGDNHDGNDNADDIADADVETLSATAPSAAAGDEFKEDIVIVNNSAEENPDGGADIDNGNDGDNGNDNANDIADDDDDDDDDDEILEAGYDNGLVTDRDIVEEDQAPSYRILFASNLNESFPWLCCCLKKYSIQQQNCFDNPDDNKVVETASTLGRVVDAIKYVLWYGFAIFFFIICCFNIGATQQQQATLAALPAAFELLYPPSYQNGTMCGWSESTKDADIQTFDTLQDLYDANYKVVHCGACGACSNWNDLSIQYTKRKLLAVQGRECAVQSAFGAPMSALVDCTESLIGFTRPCGSVWAWDYVNTRKNCGMIFFQSLITNSVSDFSVGSGDVTSAMCDEAFSGPVFAPWAGAIRRRMNIVSAIPRPKYQQCPVVEEDWDKLFGDPFNANA